MVKGTTQSWKERGILVFVRFSTLLLWLYLCGIAVFAFGLGSSADGYSLWVGVRLRVSHVHAPAQHTPTSISVLLVGKLVTSYTVCLLFWILQQNQMQLFSKINQQSSKRDNQNVAEKSPELGSHKLSEEKLREDNQLGEQDSDVEGDVVPIVIRPGHIRFEPLKKGLSLHFYLTAVPSD